MGFAPKQLKGRNKKLVKLKEELSFTQLAKLFDISEARAKEIYYREIKKKNSLSTDENSRVLDN